MLDPIEEALASSAQQQPAATQTETAPATTTENQVVNTQATPPQAEATKAENAGVSEPNYGEFLTKTFGKDESSLRGELEKAQKYGELEQQLAELKSKQFDYKSNEARIIDEAAASIADPAQRKQYIIQALEASSTDTSKMSAHDLIALDLQISNPNATKEQIAAHIEKSYALDEFATEVDKNAHAFKLNKDAQDAALRVKEWQAKSLENPVHRQAELANVNEEQRVDSVKAMTSKVFSDFTEIPLELADGTKLDSFKLDAKAKAEVESWVSEVMVAGGFQNNAEAQAQARQLAEMKYRADNFQHILNNAVSQVKSQQTQKEISEYNHSGVQTAINLGQGQLSEVDQALKIFGMA